MRRDMLIVVLVAHCVYANTIDLEQMMQDLHYQKTDIVVPSIPDYKMPAVNFKSVHFKNIFSQNRLQDSTESNLNLQNYSLNQLEMVGYMRQKSIDYAFLKTPYETILVKVGDKVKQGYVIKIYPNSVEIEELQIQDNKHYHRKVYLKLKT